MRRMVMGDIRPASILRIDSGFAQAFDRGLRFQRRIVDLFKGVRLRLRGEDRHDFDVPVIILVDESSSNPSSPTGAGCSAKCAALGENPR